MSGSEALVENLDDRIESLMRQLKSKVERVLALQGPGETKWKWDSESATLLRSIIESVEEKVETHNKLQYVDGRISKTTFAYS